ncbi:MAG: glycosyltransferase [Chloroflexota bacterium]
MIQRIALISVHASPLVQLGSDKAGGMNVYVREAAREFGRQGIKVDIYTSGLRDSSEIDFSLSKGVRVIHVPVALEKYTDPIEFYPVLNQFVGGVLATTLKLGAAYDLIYSHYWLSGWVANELRKVWGIPFVHMFHTLGFMKGRITALRGSASADLRVSVEKKVVGWANGIIAATPAEKAQLIWLYRAEREKINIISPGVDLQQFYPANDMSAVRARLGIADGCQFLLFAGRLEPLKAVDVGLEALGLIRIEKPTLLENLKFVVIGGNIQNADLEFSRLKILSRELGLSDVVDFVGSRNQSVLADYYRASLAVIVPSDYESFGMVALEAMACGTLVIASGVGGLAYLIPDGEAGWLIPARDSRILAERLEFLIINPEIRGTLSRSAAELAHQYSWMRIVEQLLGVFQGFVLDAASPRMS